MTVVESQGIPSWTMQVLRVLAAFIGLLSVLITLLWMSFVSEQKKIEALDQRLQVAEHCLALGGADCPHFVDDPAPSPAGP